MANFPQHNFFGAAFLAVSGVAAYSTYRLLTLAGTQNGIIKEKENVYETEKYISEYMAFHYGAPTDILRYECGPKEATDFPRRVAEECIKAVKNLDKPPTMPRAIEIGCSVGRTTFELARFFDEVVGVDYSQSFIDRCNLLRDKGTLGYTMIDEGDLQIHLTATIDPAIDRSRTRFQRGNASSLPQNLGQFDCVVAANVLCRLSQPSQFLERLSSLVAPGGILLLTTPCSWMTKFTPKENWTGGYINKDGEKVTTFDTLKRVLLPDFDLIEEKPFPYLIRENGMEYQWSAPKATIWKRKGNSSMNNNNTSICY